MSVAVAALGHRAAAVSGRRYTKYNQRMQSPAITPDLVKAHGLNETEYKLIEQILGRAPNYVELGIFSVMWSEHCSYKSSRVHLKKFPTTGARVVMGPGENAGVIDVGDGLGVLVLRQRVDRAELLAAR